MTPERYEHIQKIWDEVIICLMKVAVMLGAVLILSALWVIFRPGIKVFLLSIQRLIFGG
jgi:hypothetical protein